MQNRNFFAILFLFLLLCGSFASKRSVQKSYVPYYLAVYKADSLYQIDDFAGSYRILYDLFQDYEPINIDNYYEYGIYLSAAVMSGNIHGIDKKVRYGFLTFGEIRTLHKKSQEIYDKVKQTAKIKDSEISELKARYYKNLDLELRKKLLQMIEKDQNIRTGHNPAEDLENVDISNKHSLDSILAIYGIPSKKLIGNNGAYDVPDKKTLHIDILFAHQPDSVRKRQSPTILKEIETGHIEPYCYAFVFDKSQMERTLTQHYGIFTCPDNNVCTLSNPQKIDSIRKSIGLPRLGYEEWRVAQFRKSNP